VASAAFLFGLCPSVAWDFAYVAADGGEMMERKRIKQWASCCFRLLQAF